MNRIIIIASILFIITSNVKSTECKKLFVPFEEGLKNAELVVLGEIIQSENDEYFSIKIIERYKGICKDTIQYVNNGALSMNEVGNKMFLILETFNDGSLKKYTSPGCLESFLRINLKDNSVNGNITYFNALKCRLYKFFNSNKDPKNRMSFDKISRIIKESISAR